MIQSNSQDKSKWAIQNHFLPERDFWQDEIAFGSIPLFWSSSALNVSDTMPHYTFCPYNTLNNVS